MGGVMTMRKILFKGERTDNCEWVEGYYVYAPAETDEKNRLDNFVRKHWIITKNGKMYEVIPESVSEFTGLTDKNGKKIFEGDVVEHHVQADIIVNRGVVHWDSKNARWALQLRTMNPSFDLYKPEFFEVIGNIHDNPELLGGDNNA